MADSRLVGWDLSTDEHNIRVVCLACATASDKRNGERLMSDDEFGDSARGDGTWYSECIRCGSKLDIDCVPAGL